MKGNQPGLIYERRHDVCRTGACLQLAEVALAAQRVELACAACRAPEHLRSQRRVYVEELLRLGARQIVEPQDLVPALVVWLHKGGVRVTHRHDHLAQLLVAREALQDVQH
eukprot:CAMPEP_0180096114 /NCGR_PEP_ID=MMETSP0985-20121206/26512_1 /TAXON_ID=483367 /ORGANISM="non described non described, Strain CCMP 2436" /LENGTH=110 /DNA_ID=CAMNT_0022031401 /DNA_START=97 /DNA_END=426 /DNA_ORIENTATION=-